MDAPQVAAVTAVDGAERTAPALRVGGTLISGDGEFDVVLRFIDFDNGISTPTAAAGELSAPDEVLLSTKATGDLGVGVGDTGTVRHPLRQGAFAATLEESPYVVSGLHDHPFPRQHVCGRGVSGLDGTRSSHEYDRRFPRTWR